MDLRFRVVLLCGCFLTVVAPFGCTTKQEQPKEIAALNPEDHKKFDEMQNEMEIGRSMAGRMLQYYGRYDDEKLIGYINQVGNYVASYGDYPDRRYMFDIIDSDIVNAFACPGGYILVTKGAIRNARNEAELAMILGHETVHVGKKHMYSTLKNMSKEDLDKAAAEADKKLNLPDELKVRARPKPEESAGGALVARYLSGSAAGLNVLAASKAGMSVILDKGLGSELENEADAEGVKYGVRAGYDPTALIDYLCRLEESKGGAESKGKGKCAIKAKSGAKSTILEKTHPPVKERIDHINRMLANMKANEIVGAVGAARFEKYSSKLPAAKKTKTEE